MKVLAINAGGEQGSSTHRLVDLLSTATEEQAGALGLRIGSIEVITLRDLAVDLMTAQVTSEKSPAVEAAIKKVEDVDALIIASPIYNAQLAAVLSLFFEVADKSTIRNKPVLMAATGGTIRHGLAMSSSMLPLLHFLNALVVPTSIFATTEDWQSLEDLKSRAGNAAASLVRQLCLDAGISAPEPTDPR